MGVKIALSWEFTGIQQLELHTTTAAEAWTWSLVGELN